MKIFHTTSQMQAFSPEGSLGFVPTMGALHPGHLELLRRSLGENDSTLLSIFVNPTQFNCPQDLARYPQTLERDLQLAQQLGVDALFLPSVEEMYPEGCQRFLLHENALSLLGEGQSRPGHFSGMLTVVMKLLSLIHPTRAYFGEKDFQQFLLIKEMASAFFLKTQVLSHPTVRDENGLALSSRNQRLSDSGRRKAARLYHHLSQSSTPSCCLNALEREGFEVEYVQLIQKRLYAAVQLEGVRLIDNVPA